jgi:hypothetical protein
MSPYVSKGVPQSCLDPKIKNMKCEKLEHKQIFITME